MNSDEGSFFYEQQNILPVENHFNGFSTPGLIANTVYDVLDLNSANGSVSVNATTFSVECGEISEAKLATCSEDASFFLPPAVNASLYGCVNVSVSDQNGLQDPFSFAMQIVGKQSIYGCSSFTSEPPIADSSVIRTDVIPFDDDENQPNLGVSHVFLFHDDALL